MTAVLEASTRPALSPDDPRLAAIGDGRRRHYRPTLPYTMPLAASVGEHARRQAGWITQAAALLGEPVPALPTLVRDWRRRATARETPRVIAYDIAHRFANGDEPAVELLAEAQARTAASAADVDLVSDALAEIEFSRVGDLVDELVEKIGPAFDAAVSKLQEAAAEMVDPWTTKPRGMMALGQGGETPAWFDVSPLGAAARAERGASGRIFDALDAIEDLSVLALRRSGSHAYDEIIAIDDAAPTKADDLVRLGVYADADEPELALVAVAGGWLPSMSLRLQR
ncbi:hypothetical protein [Flexivirga sp. B27]